MPLEVLRQGQDFIEDLDEVLKDLYVFRQLEREWEDFKIGLDYTAILVRRN